MPTQKEILLHSLKMELNRRKFWDFCLYYDYNFFTQRSFLKQVADGLQKVADKEIKTLAVSMPPRAGKSYITSLFCAWWIGNNPTLSVMRNSCTNRLYQKLSYDVRNIVKSDLYKSVFPTVVLSNDKTNLNGWNTNTAKQVSYFGDGVGGTIIGFGANLAITDDLYKGIADALSPTVNDSTHTWKQSSHNSRKELNCAEIFIGTRWTKNDIIGAAIENEEIELNITIPALDENNKSFCEYVKTTEEYLKIKESTEQFIWEAEYMQEPVEAKGLLFPKNELKYFNTENFTFNKLQELAQYRFAFIDPADTGDSLAMLVAYLIDSKIYIVDAIYNSNGTDENEAACLQMVKKHNLHKLIIEGIGGWRLFGSNIKNKLDTERSRTDVFIMKSQKQNKRVRINVNAYFIRNNFLFIDKYGDLKEYNAAMNNIVNYIRSSDGTDPNKHDDAVDCCTYIAEHFLMNFKHLF